MKRFVPLSITAVGGFALIVAYFIPHTCRAWAKRSASGSTSWRPLRSFWAAATSSRLSSSSSPIVDAAGAIR